MNRLIFYALFYALFASCASAPKHFAKAVKKDRPYVAAETRKLFPCIVTKNSSPDSTGYKQYLKDLQDLQDFYESQEPRVDSFETIWTDSAKVVELQKQLASKNAYISDLQKKCKDNPPIRDTTYIEDSAQTTIMLNNMEVMQNLHKDELAKKEKQIAKLEADNEKKEQKIIRKNKTVKWCFILLGACALWIFGPVLWKLLRKTINPLK